MADFRGDLPKLADLHDRFVTRNKRNFFFEFPRRLESKETVTFDYYRIIENWLSYVPSSEWELYAAKVGPAALAFDEKRKRHWEKLHDVFSEATGAMVLAKEYRCTNVRLVLASASIAPDWRGEAAGRAHYVEVKTINHSLDGRLSWYDGPALVHSTVIQETLKEKIRKGYKEAIAQLSAPADAAGAIKVAAFVLYPDYNLDPIEVELSSLFMDFFTEIELADYPIRLRIFENA